MWARAGGAPAPACLAAGVLHIFLCGYTAAQLDFQVKPCSGSDASLRGWVVHNHTIDGQLAANLLDGGIPKPPVGPALNCAGTAACHSWGPGFTDRNGILDLQPATAAGEFRILSWPATKSVPVGNGQTPPGQCVTADSAALNGSRLHMRAAGANCLQFRLTSPAGALEIVDGAHPGGVFCVGTAPYTPPPPKPPPPPPPPPPYTGAAPCAAGSKWASQPYCNRSLSIAARVQSIVSQMTIWEKIAMTDSGNPGVGRLGLRPMQFGEGLHGVDANCGAAVGKPDEFGARTGCPTSYPSGIAEGATFNKSLWLAVGAADGREGRALHNQPANPGGPPGAEAGHGLAAIAFWAPGTRSCCCRCRCCCRCCCCCCCCRCCGVVS
jgi:hypothetical protein